MSTSYTRMNYLDSEGGIEPETCCTIASDLAYCGFTIKSYLILGFESTCQVQ